MKSTRTCLLTTSALLVLAVAPPPADAVVRTRVLWHGAAAVCNNTYPRDAVLMRRQAHEIRNIGTETFRVACGTMTDQRVADGAFARVTIYLQNHKNKTRSMTCTIVAGTWQFSTSIKKTVTVAPETVGNIAWTPADFGDIHKHASIHCDLPPGWSIRDLSVTYNEDVGA